MSLNNFLDRNGLNYLWSKVVNRISSSETNITAKIPIASDDLPKDLGPSSPGVSSKFSRSDHVHKVPDDIASYTDAQTGVEENADIKTLIDRKTGRTIYPQTIAKAIYDSYGKDLQTRLDELNQNYVATSAQTLTNEQKAQARGNINAAPDGFGLGGLVATIPADANLNDYIRTGFFGNGNATVIRTWVNTPANWPANEAILEVYSLGRYLIQRLSSVATKVSAQRSLLNNVWAEWEWINPPMENGIEYCTTERYLGKSVYTQIKQFDNLSTSQMYSPGGSIIRFSGETQWPLDDSGKWVPAIVIRLPNEDVTGDFPNIDFGAHYNSIIRILLAENSKCLGKSARVQMWYTK